MTKIDRKKCSIMILTNYGDRVNHDKAKKFNVDAFLVKSQFSLKQIILRIGEILA